MRRVLAIFICISSILLAGLGVPACAAIFGAVQGIVHDPDHRPLKGAQVTIKDVNSDWSQTTTTDDNGEYRFQSVPAGNYTVSASAQGFATQSRTIVVNSATTPSVHFGLTVAG